MDAKKGYKNVITAVVFKALLIIGGLLSRRFVIQFIGNEINGLNSLYTTIIGFLSVAEMGVGSAVAYCMYRPIVERDTDKVAALYGFLNKFYLITGAFIFAVGCALTPFLPILAKDSNAVDVNLYVTFTLFLLSTVLTYFYGGKVTLIEAHKNNYITTTISSSIQLLLDVLHVMVVLVTKSFVLYLVCNVVTSFISWIIVDIVAKREYAEIIQRKTVLEKDSAKEIGKNIKAMFMHKTGSILVNTADSVIISAFLGIVILGKYSNYTTIVTTMVGVISLFFTPLTSVIGHMCVESIEQANKYFDFFYTFNYVLGCIFFLGYSAVIDDLIALILGPNLELSRPIVCIITLNYFIQFMRKATLLFRDATGTFYNDRWKPLVEGVVNVVLSIVFVKLFPGDLSVVGVIVATILTNLTICHVIEPYVLFKNAFHRSVRPFYLKNYISIFAFAGVLFLQEFIMVNTGSLWCNILINGSISVFISLLITAVILVTNRTFCSYLKIAVLKVKKSFEE